MAYSYCEAFSQPRKSEAKSHLFYWLHEVRPVTFLTPRKVLFEQSVSNGATIRELQLPDMLRDKSFARRRTNNNVLFIHNS